MNFGLRFADWREWEGGSARMTRKRGVSCDRGWRIWGGDLAGQSRLIKVDQTKSDRKEGCERCKMGNVTRGWRMRKRGRQEDKERGRGPFASRLLLDPEPPPNRLAPPHKMAY